MRRVNVRLAPEQCGERFGDPIRLDLRWIIDRADPELGLDDEPCGPRLTTRGLLPLRIMLHTLEIHRSPFSPKYH